MSSDLCPEDNQLWSIVMGDSIDSDLRQHLEICVNCQQRVAALRQDVQAVRSAGWNSPLKDNPIDDTEEALPESIGEYTLLARLGSGGQADVYRAWHPRLKTDVVIKWFRKNAYLEMDPNQLTSDAQILSTIRHPYLGRVFDVGIEQGRHFIIMEYVSGHTFSAWIRGFRPTIPRIAAVLANAARAVDAVHRHGALHLDLKPDNILVDDDGNPRVIDFGMARLQGTASHRSLLLAPGTPEYMSPEQCAGDSGRISVSSDVYGLGAVLYSALCQQPIRTVEKMTLEPDWSLIHHVPWGLRRICRRALSTRPEDRYESAVTFAKVLETFAEQHSTARRSVAVVAMLLGIASCNWGLVSSSINPAMATLNVQSHHRSESKEYTVSKTKCSAVLAKRRRPCVIIATASTAPVRASELVRISDADCRIGQLANDQTSIQVSDDAGPHLIMACAEREWEQSPINNLNDWMASLQSLPLKHSIEIQMDDHQVSLLPVGEREISSEESAHRLAAVATVEKMRSAIDQTLPCYSGIVIIPPIRETMSAIP